MPYVIVHVWHRDGRFLVALPAKVALAVQQHLGWLTGCSQFGYWQTADTNFLFALPGAFIVRR